MGKVQLQFHSKFILRTPLNSFQSDIDGSLFKESLYLASSSFYYEYEKHLLNPIDNNKRSDKIETSLYKYKTRAKNRCTPFGLFAAVCVGDWKNTTNILFDSDQKKGLIRNTRLDTDVLCTLALEISKMPSVRQYLKYYPNTSLYSIGSSYRYVECNIKNNKRFHSISKVDRTVYLTYILEASENGLTITDISKLLICDDVTEGDALAFIEELIDSQIIVSEIEPSTTGLNFFDVILTYLHKIKSRINDTTLNELTSALDEINNKLKALDENISNPITFYRYIFDRLKMVLPNLNEVNLFQTDLFKRPIHATLDSSIQESIEKALQFLVKICPPTENTTLQGFKQRFYDRFYDAEVPLLLALDNETGIGYPERDNTGINRLIEDINFPKQGNTSNKIEWGKLQTVLHELLLEAVTEKKKIVKINYDDFKEVDYSGDTLPSTFSVLFKILDPITNKIEMSSAGGNSAANLLSRFSMTNETLNTILKDIVVYEEEVFSGKILAEIVHLPENRTGNILARPSLRKYEIPFLAKSHVDEEYKINMKDLFLRLSGNRLVLFDKRLNKEIIPKLSNAHNYKFNSLPVYHFLCDLQTQYFDRENITFPWGVLSNLFEFLPRIEFDNVILSPAIWQIAEADINKLKDKLNTYQDKVNAFFDIKSRIGLPDRFLIVDGDNELLIDCKNQVSLKTFLELIKGRTSIALNEFLFDNNSSCVKDTDNKCFTNEFISTVFNQSHLKNNLNERLPENFSTPKKIFNLGSEWLFYKIYCGVKTADFVLTRSIKSIVEKLFSQDLIDKWFFIRYSDPEPHLRLRLHIKNTLRIGEVLKVMNDEMNSLTEQNLVSRLITDTYFREIERYGDTSIDHVEQLFFYDSEFICEILARLTLPDSDQKRWQIGLLSINTLLNDFGFDLEQKYDLIESLRVKFFKEHKGDKRLKINIDTKYRKLKVGIENVLKDQFQNQKGFQFIRPLLDQRSKLNFLSIEQICDLERAKKLNVDVADLLASIMHMNLDRLFMSKNRANELLVYELLSRHYKSKLLLEKRLTLEKLTIN
ncbi:MAG: lantibiotic dehydratase [Sphingobacteriaceae bacterium]|nr:lantibiotic dehydratase [Sphingobacteriaceae bacterium]